MVSEELDLIIDLLKKQGETHFNEAATEKQIADYEKKNAVEFPEQYRQWLKFSDGGECFLPAGVQFYGVTHKPIVDVNDSCCSNNDYCVIGSLASGDPIVFKRGDNAISIYNLEGDCIEEDERYDDFFSFLQNLADVLGVEV